MKLNAVTRRIALAAFTLGSAASVGFVMQSGTPTQASIAAGPKPTIIAQSLQDVAKDTVMPLTEQELFDPQTEAVLPAKPIVLAVAQDSPSAAMPVEEPSPILGCSSQVSAQVAAAAMVNLLISASCQPDARVSISHAGMTFTEILDDSGTLEISIPVLQEQATFAVTFPDGFQAKTSLLVPSLRFYERVALQWMGESGLQIHAREFDAAYGDKGHVWFTSENDLMTVMSGEQGFVLRLGDGRSEISQMADVYTFPSANAARDGKIALTVEAEVNGSNCGQSIRARSFQVSPDQEMVSRTLEMSIPECSASGDFLVLKNLLQDLTIAQK